MLPLSLEIPDINNFAVLILCLVCLCIGIFGASILVASGDFDLANHLGLVNLLSSLGGFFGGCAGIIAAITAYRGIDVWKKQLKYGKHISLIWSCMESLRKFESLNMQWYISAYANSTSQIESTDLLEVEKQRIDAVLEELSSRFCTLDTIVVKNQWQWANYAGQLSNNIACLVSIFEEYKNKPYCSIELCKKLAEVNERMKHDVKFLETELDKLEVQYH